MVQTDQIFYKKLKDKDDMLVLLKYDCFKVVIPTKLVRSVLAYFHDFIQLVMETMDRLSQPLKVVTYGYFYLSFLSVKGVY